MENAKKISIFDKLGEKIFTRTTMQNFLSKISKLKENKIVLDFSNVKFISRSCADEYAKFMQDNRKKIKAVNQSPEVSMMIEVVEDGLNAILISKTENNSERVLCEN
ncbi:MAG: hypothetical protein NTU63_03530 [Candidatus Pacearchaeota archaeon]|nr:hypothetical protein [Candidatus Pacearchaeota archaeon]